MHWNKNSLATGNKKGEEEAKSGGEEEWNRRKMELMDSLISYIQFCEDCLSEALLKCRLSVGRVKLLHFSKSNLGRLLQWNSLILQLLYMECITQGNATEGG